MRLLVVEDDPDLNRQLCTALTDAGYAVDKAFDGEEGHYLGESEPYDAIVLDLGLPKMDGISVLESWRRGGKDTPVLILTARDRWSEKVQGFDAGPTITWPSPSTWKRCSPASARSCAGPPATPRASSPADPCISTRARAASR
jgi:two-component system OmpR family response regulator